MPIFFGKKSTTFIIQGNLYNLTHSDYNYDDDNNQEYLFMSKLAVVKFSEKKQE